MHILRGFSRQLQFQRAAEKDVMTREHSDKLFVNLSASQARRRLKGHGYGVRKVESAGRNQSVIIHTATGQHLRELRALLADAMPATSQDELGIPVENLRNLGTASTAWLREVGVHTLSDLQRLGPVLTYRLVKQRQHRASLNLLWAIAGALSDRDWRELTSDEKDQLRQQVDED